MTEKEIEKRKYFARQRRYRKPICRDMNFEAICNELDEIQEACEDVHWFTEDDDNSLLDELIGGEEESYEFKMMFSDLCAECEQMQDDLREQWVPECFDIFFVAAQGGDEFGGYLGWDSYEQDYFGIDAMDSFAEKEAADKLMQMTKKDLIEAMRQCFRIFSSFIALRSRYEDLKASMDIIRGQNAGFLQMVKQINELYDKASEGNFREWNDSTKRYDMMLENMPQIEWLK